MEFSEWADLSFSRGDIFKFQKKILPQANFCVFWHFLKNLTKKNYFFSACASPLKISKYWRQPELEI